MSKHKFKTKKEAYNEVVELIKQMDYAELLANEFAYNEDYKDVSERDMEWMAEAEQKFSLYIETLLVKLNE